jgi:short subunit dehydrogenase-like uncharacterized protein
MAVEAAIALGKYQDSLPPIYGCLTPSAAMGDVLCQRLSERGFNFDTKAAKDVN